MSLIEIPDATYAGVLLKGGWTTHVPEAAWRMDDARVRDLVMMLKRYGASHSVAEVEARSRLDALWRHAWRSNVMKRVARWASVFERENGSLEGFDASLVARTWMPGTLFGKQPTGNATMRELFADMRRNLHAEG